MFEIEIDDGLLLIPEATVLDRLSWVENSLRVLQKAMMLYYREDDVQVQFKVLWERFLLIRKYTYYQSDDLRSPTAIALFDKLFYSILTADDIEDSVIPTDPLQFTFWSADAIDQLAFFHGVTVCVYNIESGWVNSNG